MKYFGNFLGYLCFFTGVDQCVQKFVDIAKQLESFFLQKRLMLSVHKPEQIIKEVGESVYIIKLQ
jgi:hypothetical protein